MSLEQTIARAEVMLDMHGKQSTTAEALRIAAGCNDPAARIAVEKLGLLPMVNNTGDKIHAIVGLPVDHLDIVRISSGSLEALGACQLHSLSITGAEKLFSPQDVDRLSAMPVVDLEISGIYYDDEIFMPPSGTHLRRLSVKFNTGYGIEVRHQSLARLSGLQLEALTFNQCDGLVTEDLRAVAKLPLKELDLGRVDDLEPAGMQILNSLPLEKFAMNDGGGFYANPEFLSGFPHLKSLEMDDCAFGDRHLAAIRALPIERLSAEGSYISEDGFDDLAALNLLELGLGGNRHLDRMDRLLKCLKGSRLNKLDLSDLGCFRSADMKFLRGLALEELVLRLNHISERHLLYLADLPLKKLDLSFTSGFTGASLRRLCEMGLPLESLSLSGVELSNDDLRCLQRLPFLKELDLYGSDWLNDAGVAELSGLQLRRLDITSDSGDSLLTDACIPYLAALPLEYLCMQNRKGISYSDRGWERIAAFPARVLGPGIPY